MRRKQTVSDIFLSICLKTDSWHVRIYENLFFSACTRIITCYVRSRQRWHSVASDVTMQLCYSHYTQTIPWIFLITMVGENTYWKSSNHSAFSAQKPRARIFLGISRSFLHFFLKITIEIVAWNNTRNNLPWELENWHKFKSSENLCKHR